MPPCLLQSISRSQQINFEIQRRPRKSKAITYKFDLQLSSETCASWETKEKKLKEIFSPNRFVMTSRWLAGSLEECFGCLRNNKHNSLSSWRLTRSSWGLIWSIEINRERIHNECQLRVQQCAFLSSTKYYLRWSGKQWESKQVSFVLRVEPTEDCARFFFCRCCCRFHHKQSLNFASFSKRRSVISHSLL